MPMYTYRREDGTTFDMRQNFGDQPLQTCPTTGQRVVRIVQAAGVIFKGSGFYVTDNKGASKSAATSKDSSTPKADSAAKSESATTSTTPAPSAPAPSAAPAGD